MWYKVKRILTWVNNEEKQIYPAENKVYCDFTQSYCWFTFSWRDNSKDWYWRNSNWLYIDHTNYSWWWAVSWLVPSNIYSKWELAKIEVTCYATITNCWWWITDNNKTGNFMQSWMTLVRAKRWGSETSVNTSWNPANTEFKIIIDLDWWLISTTADGTTLTLNSTQISAAKSDWTNWNVCLNQMIWTTNRWISYIRNATFYFTS